MKAYGRDFLSAFDSSGLGETYVGMLSSEEAAHRRIALCLYCDMIECAPPLPPTAAPPPPPHVCWRS